MPTHGIRQVDRFLVDGHDLDATYEIAEGATFEIAEGENDPKGI